MKKFRNWVLLLHDDPERWLLNTSAMGGLLFFVLARVAHHPTDLLLTGAAMLCWAVFWLFLILGMTRWP